MTKGGSHRRRFRIAFRRSLIAALFLAAYASIPTSAQVAPELIRLARIKAEAKRSVEKLTDYTCELLVERGHVGRKAREKLLAKAAKSPFKEMAFALPPDTTDAVELEVAVVSGEEHFAWSGDDRFERTSLIKLVGFGLASTGEFHAHLKSVLVNGQGLIEYAGAETIDGRNVHRYDYAVSLFRSGYELTTPLGTAKVPYGGSFWADAESHHVIQMTVRAIDIPVNLGAEDVSSTVTYREITEGEETYLLPRGAVVTMDMTDGSFSRNAMQFSDCRSFQAATEISFEVDENTFFVERRETLPWAELPAGITLPLRLETPIDSRKDRIGKAIEAVLRKDVEVDDGLVLPKGALVRGRLRVVHHHTDGDPYWLIGLEFREIELADRRVRLNAEIVDLQSVPLGTRDRSVSSTRMSSGSFGGLTSGSPGGLNMATNYKRYEIETLLLNRIPGVAMVRIHGKSAKLPKGFWSTWVTQ